ncbi:hypothetical protein OQA88_10796 [Cercophora sp. LCS_1]
MYLPVTARDARLAPPYLGEGAPGGFLSVAGSRIKTRIKRAGSAVKEKSRRMRPQNTDSIEIDISDLSLWARLQGGFPLGDILRVDRAEWALVEEHNFGGPSQPLDNDDNERHFDEIYLIKGHIVRERLAPVASIFRSV